MSPLHAAYKALRLEPSDARNRRDVRAYLYDVLLERVLPDDLDDAGSFDHLLNCGCSRFLLSFCMVSANV